MLHRYFVKLATLFSLLFVGLIVLSHFVSSPFMIALVGFALLLCALGSVYFLLFKPLQNAFDTIERLEAREKSEREATKQTFLHVSQNHPFINALFQKIYTLLGILTHLSENYSQSAGKNSIATAQLMFSIDTMSKKLEEKAQGISEISASAQNIFEHVNRVSTNSQEASTFAKLSMSESKKSIAELNEIIAKMNNINVQTADASSKVNDLREKSITIQNVTTVIDDIADQTNLLALNAAIEAARGRTWTRICRCGG